MKIAAKYNGGGHTAASGCTMMMPLQAAKKILIEECRKQLR
jgi:nanoRNase/pAp phosphatase (c-di-AMP/oligoRNAs hydrolase)